MRTLKIFSERAKEMDVKERHDANFIMNLSYLYKKQGVKKTDDMLRELGTDVDRKNHEWSRESNR